MTVMLVIVHCLGLYQTQCFGKWICFHHHHHLYRFIFTWAHHQKLCY
jgi:hypothetical protein